MRIAFLGIGAIDYAQIGGTESFVRRLAGYMAAKGHHVDYIIYGMPHNYKTIVEVNITVRYCCRFSDALALISSGRYAHVVSTYLFPMDRVKFGLFRKLHHYRTRFHYVFFSWPDSMIKRELYFSEAALFPYSGRLFCISRRQYEFVKPWATNVVYLMPPVPEKYFLEKKPLPTQKIKLVFLGRIDPGKGVNEVLDIFEKLHGNPVYELGIYGMHRSTHSPSVEIHNWLATQTSIKYVSIDRSHYSSAIDNLVREILCGADIFIQPYKKLSSSIDMPLLLLEAMASLCAVMTKPLGNIPDVYGESPFLLYEKDFVTSALRLLLNVDAGMICKERERILDRNKHMAFGTVNVGEKFLEALNECK